MSRKGQEWRKRIQNTFTRRMCPRTRAYIASLDLPKHFLAFKMSPHFFALFLRKARRFQREDFEKRVFLSSSRDVRKRPATERPRVKDSYEPV